MKVSVIPTAQQAQGIDFGGKTAVVIDVLRATSVVTTALDNGAREVVPASTVEEAQSLYAQSAPSPHPHGRKAHVVGAYKAVCNAVSLALEGKPPAGAVDMSVIALPYAVIMKKRNHLF